MNEVTFSFQPRDYQRPFLEYMANGGLRACMVWHRRGGKDLAAFNMCILKALERVGTYFYLLPTYAQAKKIIWDGITGGNPQKNIPGVPFLSFIPDQIIAGKNENEMQIKLVNGSIIQLVGTDNIDRVVGTNPVGCVFSEFALQNSMAWELLAPILLENGGWAVFISTPRGRNHFYKQFIHAQTDPTWFCQRLTVDDTKREDGQPVISKDDIAALLKQGQDPDLVEQEYYVSFEGSVQGSYYSQYLKLARSEGRIGQGERFDWDARYRVRTAWDLGVGDDTTILFYQRIGPLIRIIDAYANRGFGVDHYAAILKSKPYVYERHYGPHDLVGREWGTGDSRARQAAVAGVHFTIVKKAPIDDGIAAVRRIFHRLRINEARCGRFLDAIAFYHRERTDAGGALADDSTDAVFANKPVHDWSSHFADALRYLAQGEEHHMKDGAGDVKRQVRADTVWNPFVKDEPVYETDHDFDPLQLGEPHGRFI